ncbi:MAG: hypothetical protein ACHQD8_02005 [Chitinophagales bacterium]
MRNIVLIIFTAFSFLLVCPGTSYAQNRVPTRVPHPPPPPHVNPYKKKDTTKPNPYLIDTPLHPIPMGRQLFHDKIDKEQQQDDLADGKADSIISYGNDSALTAILTKALLKDVDHIQVMIENMPANGREPVMDNQQRIRYLRAMWEMMRQYSSDPKPGPEFYKNLVANMHDMLIALNENKMLAFVRTNTNIYTLDNGKVLFDNQPEARAYIYTEMGKADPLMMIKRLQEYSSDTFAGSIIKVVARLKPDLVFNYASSTDRLLRNPVYNTQDELVQAIVKIAMHSKSPLKALPFLSDVYYRRKTIVELDTIAEHPDLYFENLVRLKLENDSIARRIYTQELSYRALKYFVREMNDLHESKEEVRFRCLDSLSAKSLYFIMVYGQDEIYTSSFLGTFKRMMERMKPIKGDQLLDSLHYDHFRTFIRMCAGYNTLSDFLGTIDDTTKTTLMASFIGGLQKGKEDDLEDAVDVADAFGSIRDSTLSAFLQKKVKENYELSYKERSKKGMIVYSLLAMLFEGNKISGSDTGAAVASSRLRLPPINKVRYKDLINDSGIVYQQVFFYGDEDGQNSYESYLIEFKKDKNWHIDTTNKLWTVISSVKGKKVVIYANLPLKEPDDEDAQDKLIKYLNDSGIHPTIMIHRGHSYHLPVTLSKLNKEVKIVILGSCGGYHNLAIVLDHAPDAHIISSKQVGATWVNEPIIKALNARLLEGSDVNWIAIWRELDEYFVNKPELKEKFNDYVPPYKNLGAIFIKAYRRMMHN